MFYVFDPDDEMHLIAVGTRDDWDNNVLREFGAPIFALALTAIYLGLVAGRIVPEDADAGAGRVFDAVEKSCLLVR